MRETFYPHFEWRLVAKSCRAQLRTGLTSPDIGIRIPFKKRSFLIGPDPTDPSFFAGEFRNAVATANFTVLLNGVTFTIKGARSSGVFAEMGTERNGLFLGP